MTAINNQDFINSLFNLNQVQQSENEIMDNDRENGCKYLLKVFIVVAIFQCFKNFQILFEYPFPIRIFLQISLTNLYWLLRFVVFFFKNTPEYNIPIIFNIESGFFLFQTIISPFLLLINSKTFEQVEDNKLYLDEDKKVQHDLNEYLNFEFNMECLHFILLCLLTSIALIQLLQQQYSIVHQKLIKDDVINFIRAYSIKLEQSAGELGWSDESCIICMDDFAEGQNQIELECGHTFHSDCIENWFITDHQDMKCPTCRRGQASMIIVSSNQNDHLLGEEVLIIDEVEYNENEII